MENGGFHSIVDTGFLQRHPFSAFLDLRGRDHTLPQNPRGVQRPPGVHNKAVWLSGPEVRLRRLPCAAMARSQRSATNTESFRAFDVLSSMPTNGELHTLYFQPVFSSALSGTFPPNKNV